MIKKLLIVLAIISMLVVTGCTGGNTQQGNWNTFIGGTEGLYMEFEIDSPPNEISVGDPFYVMVRLENKGEHTVLANEYQLRLKGFSAESFGTSTDALIITNPSEDLEANRLDPDEGSTIESYPVYIDIPADQSALMYEGGIAGNTDFPFMVEVCYTYITTANGKLCVKEKLTDSTDTDVCMVSGEKAISSSAAPVQISGLKEYTGGTDAVRFSFNVIAANAGGSISEPGSSCEAGRTSEDRIMVTVDLGDSFNSGLECRGLTDGDARSGYIRLSSGSRQVTCTLNLAGMHDSDFVKIVQITAEYDYEQSIRKDVLVKQIE